MSVLENGPTMGNEDTKCVLENGPTMGNKDTMSVLENGPTMGNKDTMSVLENGPTRGMRIPSAFRRTDLPIIKSRIIIANPGPLSRFIYTDSKPGALPPAAVIFKDKTGKNSPMNTHATSTPTIHPFNIGNVCIPNPLILAPMAGITDPVFRPVIKKMGAGLIFSEMISCMALKYNNKKTHFMLDFSPEELPIAMQLFGSDPEAMAAGAKLMESNGVSIVDINLGCSVPKVAKAGAGAVICRDLPLLTRILEQVVKAVSIPVTIKIRKGWSKDEISAFEVCRIARECGVAAITIHGRTSGQKFSGISDWDFVKELRSRVDLPLIGNGDIREPQQVKEMLDYTGCDAIMIGREAYSNPWIFRDAADHLLGNPQKPAPSFEEVRELILGLQEGMIARYGDRQGTKKMRKFAAWFTRGLPDSTFFRDKVFKVESDESLQSVVENYFSWLRTKWRTGFQ